MRGLVFRHCEKNYVVTRRSNPAKNSVNQNFFNYFLDCHVASLLAMTIWHPCNNADKSRGDNEAFL
ncbi:hypothetical protein [Rickettsia hoogstraalii]|uniref:hypothetical protein n=1 Tax=Rickettsia hoogstraalii TaxID=467174 RepID=UPI000A479A7F|nr:hypothetical protein [Rickettsia hoogstraalii]